MDKVLFDGCVKSMSSLVLYIVQSVIMDLLYSLYLELSYSDCGVYL